MQPITSSYIRLSQAIESGDSIVVNQEGQWYKRHWLTAFVRKILGWEESDRITAAKMIAKTVKRLPVQQQTEGAQGLRQSDHFDRIQTLIRSVRKSIDHISRRENQALQSLKQKKLTYAKGSQEYAALKAKIQSLREKCPVFRVERALTHAELSQKYLGISQTAIAAQEICNEDQTWLEAKVEDWLSKQKVPLLAPESKNDIQKKILRTLRYPDFVEAIRKDAQFREIFFKSILKNSAHGSEDSVDLFIQAPAIQKLLRKSFLDKRLQKVANNGLRFIQSANTGSKEAQLLIHGRYQNISWQSNMVETGNGIRRTVDSMFKKFQKMSNGLVDIEFIQSGVEEYDFELRKFDFNQPEWWKKLPQVEVRSKEWVKEHFGLESLDENLPLLSLRATRTTRDLNGAGTHAFLDVYLPLGDGTYNIISPGKYADFFPKGVLETLRTCFSTEKGTFTLVDPNKFMHREHKEVLLPPLSKKHFGFVMDELKTAFEDARDGRMCFQAQGDNCTTPVARVLQRLYPHVDIHPFRIRFSQAVVPQPLKLIQDARKLFSTESQWNVFRKIVSIALFGAWQGRSYVAKNGNTATSRLMTYPIWDKGEFDLPSRLFETGPHILHAIHQRRA